MTRHGRYCVLTSNAPSYTNGGDPDKLPRSYADIINAITKDRPTDLSITNHACRGNRIDAATRFVALDQLCLSPQCGLASPHEGKLLSKDKQWAKLKLIAGIARDIWSDA